MKGDVQTHFQNTETDEGYFEIFFLFCPIWDQTIGDRYILKAFLPSASLLLLDKERVFVLSDVWGIFMTKNWVLKPEYGASLFFFLAFVFSLGYEVYNLHDISKKKSCVKFMLLLVMPFTFHTLC